MLNDLVALVSNEQAFANSNNIPRALTIWELLCDENYWQGAAHTISDDGMVRMRRLRKILQPFIVHRQRQSLRGTVETIWRLLACRLPFLEK